MATIGHSQMNPTSAIQSILVFSLRYRLPIFFWDNRKYGARITEGLLRKYAWEVQKKFESQRELRFIGNSFHLFTIGFRNGTQENLSYSIRKAS